MSPLELPNETYFERTGITPARQRLRIGQRLTAMKLYSSLFIAAALVLCIITTTVKAQEKLNVDDFQLTPVCAETVKKGNFKTFKKDIDSYTTPEITMRQPEAKLRVDSVTLSFDYKGLLFQLGEEAVLHCYVYYYSPNFIVVERTERFMIFENGGRQATEAHIHSYISCGSNCGYARFESITFFDDPKVPTEEAGMLHTVPLPPLYWLGGDTHPNEYPSRWFRSYLTEEERVVFDQIIEEG